MNAGDWVERATSWLLIGKCRLSGGELPVRCHGQTPATLFNLPARNYIDAGFPHGHGLLLSSIWHPGVSYLAFSIFVHHRRGWLANHLISILT